jgi:hypothetical protein
VGVKVYGAGRWAALSFVLILPNALAGCDRAPNNPKICLEPPSLQSDLDSLGRNGIAPEERETGLAIGCVHRWSYRLAQSREPADVVARAVVDGACEDTVRKTEARAFYLNKALYHVVQARAGRCKVP